MPNTMLNGVTAKSADGGYLTVGEWKTKGKQTRNKTAGNKDFRSIQTCRKCQEKVGDDGISCDRCLCWLINNWNGLPEHIVSSKSLNLFKNRIDEHYSKLKYTTGFTA